MGTAFSEAKLIKIASGFEAATHARRPPTFIPTEPLPKGIDAFTGKSAIAVRLEKIKDRLDAKPQLRSLLRNL